MKKISLILAIVASVFSCIAQQGTDMKAYILTPEQADSPRFNGAKVIGVGSGSSVLFRVPVTGKRPMSFSATNLPEGLVQDRHTGIISGNIQKAGEYMVKELEDHSKAAGLINLTKNDLKISGLPE